MTTLIGKIFHLDEGEYYKTGVIVEAVEVGYYLVSYDSAQEDDCMELVSIEEIACRPSPNGGNAWRLFSSRGALQKWIDWVDAPSPDRPKVVDIKGARK